MGKSWSWDKPNPTGREESWGKGSAVACLLPGQAATRAQAKRARNGDARDCEEGGSHAVSPSITALVPTAQSCTTPG